MSGSPDGMVYGNFLLNGSWNLDPFHTDWTLYADYSNYHKLEVTFRWIVPLGEGPGAVSVHGKHKARAKAHRIQIGLIQGGLKPPAPSERQNREFFSSLGSPLLSPVRQEPHPSRKDRSMNGAPGLRCRRQAGQSEPQELVQLPVNPGPSRVGYRIQTAAYRTWQETTPAGRFESEPRSAGGQGQC